MHNISLLNNSQTGIRFENMANNSRLKYQSTAVNDEDSSSKSSKANRQAKTFGLWNINAKLINKIYLD